MKSTLENSPALCNGVPALHMTKEGSLPPASPSPEKGPGGVKSGNGLCLFSLDGCSSPPVTGPLREDLECFQRTAVGGELLSANLTGNLVSSWKYNPSAKFPTIFILEHLCFLRFLNGLNF